MRFRTAAFFLCVALPGLVGCTGSDGLQSVRPTTDEVVVTEIAEGASDTNMSASGRETDESMRQGSVAEVSDIVGAEVLFPEDILGGVKAVYLAREQSNSERAAVVYNEGDIVVRILKLDPQGAVDFVTDLDDQQGFGPWIEVVTVRNHEGRAHEKLDVPAEWDQNGVAKSGTGVSTGAATVMWSQGSYVVTVASGEKNVAELLACAEEIRLNEGE